MPAHTSLARFIAGAYTLSSSAIAGAAASAAIPFTATTAGAAAPFALPVLGALAAFAGGIAVYKGVQQNKADARTAEVHTYLERLIEQHGSLVKALAALPDNIPLDHAESCDRLRRLAAIFISDAQGIESRLQIDSEFTRFAADSMQHIETMLVAQQYDLDRHTQMLLNAKVLNEDQLAAIDRLESKIDSVIRGQNDLVESQKSIISSCHRSGESISIIKNDVKKIIGLCDNGPPDADLGENSNRAIREQVLKYRQLTIFMMSQRAENGDTEADKLLFAIDSLLHQYMNPGTVKKGGDV